LDQFLQQLLNGLFLGSIYALIALGYTMVYGVLRFINFAHGDVFMLGAFCGMLLHRWCGAALSGLPWPVSALLILLAAMLVCACIGILIEFLAYRPLRQRPRLNVLITAIGVSLFIEYVCQHQKVFGPTQQPFPQLVPKDRLAGLGGLTVTNIQVIVLGMTVALLVALRYIVLKTRLGLAMRALSLNPTAAALMGVNTSVVISFTFGIGSALAAAGGILYASLYPSIEPFMGVLPGLKAFVAAVLGGIGNIPGAALGGLIIGVVETLVAGYSGALGIPSGYKDGVAFVILILILLMKPSGLLGKVEREKV
jgi:branched-chain amino acid transport system permease protein